LNKNRKNTVGKKKREWQLKRACGWEVEKKFRKKKGNRRERGRVKKPRKPGDKGRIKVPGKIENLWGGK